MIINFYWCGNNFTYYNYLTIMSHIRVGHTPMIHLYGSKPKSEYWDLLPIDKIEIKSVSEINQYKAKGHYLKYGFVNLWKFNFLYNYGGYFADMDMIALKLWPNNTEWVLCGWYKNILAGSVIKAPPKEKVFLDIHNHIIKGNKFNNVSLVNKYYKKNKGNKDFTHDKKVFYPYPRWDCDMIFKPYNLSDFDDITCCIHLYTNNIDRHHTDADEHSLLSNIEQFVFNDS